MSKNQNLNTQCVTELKIGSEFKDYSRTGKDRKWKERKKENIKYSRALRETAVYRKKAERAYTCANYLTYLINEDKSIDLHQVYFCKSKLCPVCQWRYAMKHSYQASEILNVAQKRYPKAKYLFLTLTIKNCKGKDLGDSMRHLTKSFDRLFKRKLVKQNMIGYLRSTEVTYNSTTKTFHPHLHVLMMVSTTYFKDSKNYVKQSMWQSMWKECARLDYLPQVDIRRVKAKNGNDADLKDAILETAKYPVKPLKTKEIKTDEYSEVIDYLEKGLNRKRQIAYGLALAEIKKELNQEDLNNEKADLLRITENDEDKENTGLALMVAWNYERKNYFIKDIVPVEMIKD